MGGRVTACDSVAPGGTTPDAVDLDCPRCRGRLAESPERLRCGRCGRDYPIVDGIPCFAEVDEFFEGTWSHSVRLPSSRPVVRAFLSMFQYYGVTRYLSRLVAGDQNLILDLGCGGGQECLTLKGRVVGVDLSRQSLTQAGAFYDLVVAADARRLPFPSGVFDHVVSVFLLEHFEGARKDEVIREMARVLKPGGGLVVYTDTDSDKRLIRWAKRSPDLYRKYFIDQAGHVGLESAALVAGRFERSHMTQVRATPKNTSNAIFPMSWVAWFDNEYVRRATGVGAAVRISRWLVSRKRLNQVVESIVVAINAVSDLVMPSRCATHVLITCRKPLDPGR